MGAGKMTKTSEDAMVDLPIGAKVFAVDYLLSLVEKIRATPPDQMPIIIKCTSRDLVLNTMPEIGMMESDNLVKLEQIGGYQEQLNL